MGMVVVVVVVAVGWWLVGEEGGGGVDGYDVVGIGNDPGSRDGMYHDGGCFE